MNFKPIFFHGAVEAITGYTQEEFIKCKIRWDQIICPDELPYICEDNKEIISIPEYSNEREYLSLITKDGRCIPTEYSGSMVKDKKGTPKYIITVGRDITERKRIEEELENYRSHLEELVKERTIQLTATNKQLWEEIIQRRKMEKGLRESEKKFRSLIESAIDYIYIYWTKKVRFCKPIQPQLEG